jgi:ATP-binding cassette subfamily F protein 3
VRYPGNYSRYLELKAERFQSALNAWEAQQDYLRKEDAFIKKHMGSQRTGEAKGRRKKLENVERLERPWHDVRRPVIQVRAAERGGELVVQTEGLAVGYGGRARVSNVDLRIGRGERVGIVGPNGSGKTTLLKVLAGRNAPLAGKLERGYKATCGYYDQETQELRDESTPFLEIRRDHPQITDLEIRSHLARFLFRGDEVDLLVRGLSGGERARLSLARLVLTGPSWLALDEPTNHLDLAGRTALEEMLGAFAGTFLCVTHDREMLDRLATRIIEVKDGRARVFEGNYTDYRSELTAERAAVEEEAVARERKVKEAARRAESKAAAAPRPAERPAKRPKNPWRLQKLEEQIIALEAERERLLAALSTEEVYRDQVELKETQLRLAEIERDLDEKNTEWEQFIG